MTKIFNLNELDVIFISYDEPNAEMNWANVLNVIPWAQRVHGVKGSDAAHKAAANLSSTDRFITIDGDNFLHGDPFDQFIEIDDSVDYSKSVLSWPAYNVINGLMYGNGGVKCWPKDVVLNMRTHEHAPADNPRAQVDFCWDINYIPIDRCFTEIRNNTTPKQAWRAGFREGVKMCLNDGVKVEKITDIYPSNLNRLKVWMTIGADTPNGLWAMFGARMGCYKTMFDNWNYIQVRDFDVLDSIWEDAMLAKADPEDAANVYGACMKPQLDLPNVLSPSASKFFKSFDFNPDRQPKTVTVK